MIANAENGLVGKDVQFLLSFTLNVDKTGVAQNIL